MIYLYIVLGNDVLVAEPPNHGLTTSILHDGKNDSCLDIPNNGMSFNSLDLRMIYTTARTNNYPLKLITKDGYCKDKAGLHVYVPRASYQVSTGYNGLFSVCKFVNDVQRADGVNTCTFHCPCADTNVNCTLVFISLINMPTASTPFKICDILV